jgi:hypothetical protein
MGNSKELKNIVKAIDKWSKKHKGKVEFHCAFLAYKDESFEIFDDGIFAYGNKDTLLISLKEVQRQIKKDKDKVINW